MGVFEVFFEEFELAFRLLQFFLQFSVGFVHVEVGLRKILHSFGFLKILGDEHFPKDLVLPFTDTDEFVAKLKFKYNFSLNPS